MLILEIDREILKIRVRKRTRVCVECAEPRTPVEVTRCHGNHCLSR